MQAVAWLGTTQPSFRLAVETLNRLVGVWMSKTTLWRCHREVAGETEQGLTQEEQQLSDWGSDREQEREHVAARAAVEGQASVSIDGTLIRIEGEGFREVKRVSVAEVER